MNAASFQFQHRTAVLGFAFTCLSSPTPRLNRGMCVLLNWLHDLNKQALETLHETGIHRRREHAETSTIICMQIRICVKGQSDFKKLCFFFCNKLQSSSERLRGGEGEGLNAKEKPAVLQHHTTSCVTPNLSSVFYTHF